MDKAWFEQALCCVSEESCSTLNFLTENDFLWVEKLLWWRGGVLSKLREEQHTANIRKLGSIQKGIVPVSLFLIPMGI